MRRTHGGLRKDGKRRVPVHREDGGRGGEENEGKEGKGAMTTLASILKAILDPHASTTTKPPDLVEFEEARTRMHSSAKRLAKAVDDDKIGTMINRLKKKRNGRQHP